MGKKAKTGKARKDKFYHLAKETGYRARSAFKLLQLNRKYEFLQKSRVCIDLGAAPGGWLQVASQNMPLSSVIVGVDLVSIKPIHNVTTIQEDITSDKCRQILKKQLQEWKADVVLHDGAPNVGKNWIHDAYQQAILTLQALKLATDFLRKGGVFVTKVFRSKDYHALMWVFKQLFKKVHATKPQASRNESAEIFVVCQQYKAPDKLDPKFTDPKHVFKDVEGEVPGTLNLIHPEKKKKRALGYADNDYTLHHKLTASDFVTADNHLERLAECNQIVIDDPFIEKHPATTAEIRLCINDIKLLGKKEIKNLISWRKKLRDFLEKQAEKEKESTQSEDVKEESRGEEEEEMEEGAEEETSEKQDDKEGSDNEELKDQIATLEEAERKDVKKKRKKVMKEKRKLRDKMSLGMSIPGDQIETTDDVNLFDLKAIKRKAELATVSGSGMADSSDDSDDEDATENKRVLMSYDRYANEKEDEEDGESEDESEAGSEVGEEEEESELEMESDDEDASQNNPLVVELDPKDVRDKNKMDMWFSKDAFAGLEGEKDEDMEVDRAAEDYRKKGGVVLEKEKKSRKRKLQESEDSGHASESEEEIDIRGLQAEDSEDSSSDEDSDDSDDSGDSDSSGDYNTTLKTSTSGISTNERREESKSGKTSHKNGFEVVPVKEINEHQIGTKVIKLDPVELALGEEMVKSSKRRRELVEDSYHRYVFDDQNLPDWFYKDERRHMKKQLPVSKSQIDEYKEKLKAIDARPIKKIAEAKARKKKKSMRKMERARKKAEVVNEEVDVTDKERWSKIKDIYKKAGLLKKEKRDISYVVCKKGSGKRIPRPAGVQGQYKVVDPRMKKDMRKQKDAFRKSKGKSGGKGNGKTSSKNFRMKGKGKKK